MSPSSPSPSPPPPLAALAPLLAEEPALRAVVNRQPTVAVPDAARAVFVASLAGVTTRRPLLLAVPTGAEAERLVRDLGQFLGDGEVELFPAWETLPFERVSPSYETMGRRLRVMWRLRAGTPPQVVVAPVRALVQRLGPHADAVEPVVVKPGDQVDRDELVARLVAGGYRREYQVEARGEVAVRGSIVDVYPSTDDHPVRIDLWGDEVDRLSQFSVADQRSSAEITESWIFPVRELLPSDEVRARARELLQTQPWGREQWERLAEGNTFDGMESWLPWLTSEEHLLPDLLPASALVAIIEPRRLRDRAQELLDEEAALAQTLATTWGKPVDEADTPRLSLPFERLLAHTKAQPGGTGSRAATSVTILGSIRLLKSALRVAGSRVSAKASAKSGSDLSNSRSSSLNSTSRQVLEASNSATGTVSPLAFRYRIMAMSGTTPEPAPIRRTGLSEGLGQRKCPPSGPRSSIVSPTWATS